MKVLLCCMYLNGLHGSVLHVLEYAEFFRSMGADVSIGTIFIDPEIKRRADKAGISVFKIDEVSVDTEYDLVYALHLFLFPYLLFRGLKYKRSILSLLSLKHSLEQLPPSCMYPYYDLITAISPEIINRYHNDFKIDLDLFTLIPNAIPMDFIKKSGVKSEWAESPRKVAVVSNHKVPEILEMAEKAPWATDFYGSEYGVSAPITPALLLEYDVIMTIGKTVQYAMGLGIPVFEYDYNGGCGYITPENLEKESESNFSGRGTNLKMDSDTLIKTLNEEYPNVVEKVVELRSMALEKFSIAKLIAYQLKLLAKLPPRKNIALTPDAWFFANSCYMTVLPYICGEEE